MKAYEELTISDDFMFGKVMENEELAKGVLQCVLGRAVGELDDLHSQHEIRNGRETRSIRMDLYTKDNRAIYDAEMQNKNNQGLERLNLAKRSRYYQSTMDVDYLMKQNRGFCLPEGNVIFICTFDPFGAGKCRYVFENVCRGHKNIHLRDEAFKHFINCTAYESDEELSNELRGFCRYVMTGAASTELTYQLDDEVRRIRRNEKGRSQYMKEMFYYDDLREEAWTEGLEQGREEGLKQGIEQGRELERQRADALEKEVQELRALLAGQLKH